MANTPSEFNPKKDPRRWVLATLRDGGKSEAQFPLPVTRNSIRVQFDKDIPQVVPFHFVEGIRQAAIPHFERKTAGNQEKVAGVRGADDIVMVYTKYICEVKEIPVEFQTISGIDQFVKEVLPVHEDYDEFRHARMSIASTPDYSYHFSDQVEAFLAAKNPKTPETAGLNSQPRPDPRKKQDLV